MRGGQMEGEMDGPSDKWANGRINVSGGNGIEADVGCSLCWWWPPCCWHLVNKDLPLQVSSIACHVMLHEPPSPPSTHHFKYSASSFFMGLFCVCVSELLFVCLVHWLEWQSAVSSFQTVAEWVEKWKDNHICRMRHMFGNNAPVQVWSHYISFSLLSKFYISVRSVTRRTATMVTLWHKKLAPVTVSGSSGVWA